MDTSEKFKYCENIKITEFNHIQEFAYFIAFDCENMTVNSVSENFDKIYLNNNSSILGQNIFEIIEDKSKTILAKAINVLVKDNNKYFCLELNFSLNKIENIIKQCYLYKDVNNIIIEIFIENKEEEENELITNSINNFNRKIINFNSNSEDLSKELCHLVREVTSFDRVYYCQFEADGHGYVSAESKEENCESYLHHHFPASDVPQNVRTLYVKNRMRIVANANYKPIKIVGNKTDFHSEFSIVRNIGKTHLQYLKNMNISTSASFSVVENGLLKGLIGCHNYSKKTLSLLTMNKISLLVDSFSQKIQINQSKSKDIFQSDSLIDFKKNYENVECHIEKMQPEHFNILKSLIKFDSIIYGNNTIIKFSENLKNKFPENDLKSLLDYLKENNVNQTNEIFKIKEYFKDIPEISGIMYFNIDDISGDFFALVRAELIHSLKWSGNPNDFSSLDGNIGPRNSFKTWYQDIKNKSEKWGENDLYFHKKIKTIIIEARSNFLNNLEINNKILFEKNKQIEILLSEVHHRVKNNLAILNALFDWKIKDTKVEEIINTLKEMKSRVLSISLLHEALYQDKNFGSVDLKKYINGLTVNTKNIFNKKNNIKINTLVPANVYIPLQQSLPLGLIIHEFITNSIKYAFKENDSGEIQIQWQEHTDNFNLILQDNGVGFKDLTNINKNSIGMQLIKLLTQQLDGNYTFDGSAGVKLEITFNKRKCKWLKTNS